jgi:DNA invertase Pin-like site-specific DNA recombinase
MPAAYSYLRFSSPQQAAGDSIRRQTQNREAWLGVHPDVWLDTSLVMTDAGRSAFRRKDWDTYALARFVDCIKAGKVEKGSYLLVENLDRLSREDAGEATELFLSIVNKGIVVVQLSPLAMEFRKPVNVQSLMFAIVELSRGHSESAIKSERGRACWAKKQANAASRIVTRKLPGWIRYDDGKLVLDREGAKAVRRTFALARDGYGASTIAKKLNSEGVPVLGKKEIAERGQSHLDPTKRKKRTVLWSAAVVWHILRSRATIGEYVPYRKRRDDSGGKPVHNYYPAVIDEGTFHCVQAAIARRGKVGRGRRGKHINLFAGLLVDARDGGALSYWHTRVAPATLISVNAKEGRGAEWTSFPAAPFEEAILSRLVEIKPSDIQGDSNEGRKVELTASRLAEIDTLIGLWTNKMDDQAIVDTVAAKLAELGARRKSTAAELAEAQRDAASPAPETWGEFRSLAAMLKNPSYELRMKVQAALRRSLDNVYCVFVRRGSYALGGAVIYFQGGTRRSYTIIHRRSRAGNHPAATWCGSIRHPSGLPFNMEGLKDPDDVESVRQFLDNYPQDLMDRLLRGEPLATPEEIRAHQKGIGERLRNKSTK